MEIKNKNNKLMYLRRDHNKLLGKKQNHLIKDWRFKKYWIRFVSVYDDIYIKTKIRTYDHRVYTNFRGLNVSVDDGECESFTIISIDSLLVYKSKHHLLMYLDNCDTLLMLRVMSNA